MNHVLDGSLIIIGVGVTLRGALRHPDDTCVVYSCCRSFTLGCQRKSQRVVEVEWVVILGCLVSCLGGRFVAYT